MKLHWLARFASPIVVLAIWEIASRSAWVDPKIVPPPSAAFADIWELIVTGELFTALWASLRRVFAGFVISVTLGVLIGTGMARSSFVETVFDPLVELIRPVSPLAIFPLAMLWFGIGDGSKIFLIALACSFPVILNTYAGVRSIDGALVLASRSLGANNREVFLKIILPGSLPGIFTGVRLAWGISLIVIIAAEMIGAVNGIGYMILNAQQVFQVERVFAGIIIVGVLGFLTDLGFRYLRRRLMPWQQEARA
jgi:ABC-type nitrate/sulfonate/bicarbonate transport system permease component